MKKDIIKIDGMSCNHCVNAVKGTLEKLGAASVLVSLEEKSATVEYDESKLNLEKLKAAIVEEGYDVI